MLRHDRLQRDRLQRPDSGARLRAARVCRPPAADCGTRKPGAQTLPKLGRVTRDGHRWRWRTVVVACTSMREHAAVSMCTRCVCRERVRSSDVADSPADAIEAAAQSGEAAKISQQLEVVVVGPEDCAIRATDAPG